MRLCLAAFAALLVATPGLVLAQTQHELHVQADSAYRRADSTLNAVYAGVVSRYQNDSLALRKLRVAERAWLAYRDAQVEATFPAIDKQAEYGSVYPMCVLILLRDLTESRIAELRKALAPDEGDVCGGRPS
jgi:uncharacterized protein YecT (DUF1311 family)